MPEQDPYADLAAKTPVVAPPPTGTPAADPYASLASGSQKDPYADLATKPLPQKPSYDPTIATRPTTGITDKMDPVIRAGAQRILQLSETAKAQFGGRYEIPSGTPRNIQGTTKPSLHNLSLATDLFPKDPKALPAAALWATQQPGVKTVIFNRHIWNPSLGPNAPISSWPAYHHDPHTDHVHVDYGMPKAPSISTQDYGGGGTNRSSGDQAALDAAAARRTPAERRMVQQEARSTGQKAEGAAFTQKYGPVNIPERLGKVAGDINDSVYQALANAIDYAAGTTGTADRTIGPVAKPLVTTAAGLVNPVSYLAQGAQLVTDPVKLGNDLGASILAITDPKATWEERLNGAITLFAVTKGGEALVKGVTPEIFGKVKATLEDPRATGKAPEHTTPETPEALAAQMDALVNGRRKAVLVTPGETMPDVPQGHVTTETPVGTFIHHDTLTPEEIHAKVADGTHGELLGHVEPKSDATTQVVVARDAKTGAEIQASVVSLDNIPAQVAEFEKQHPGATIEVGGKPLAESIVSERGKTPETGAQSPDDGNTTDTTGVAQRVHDTRAAAGKIGEVTPGEGSVAQDQYAAAEKRIRAGVDPVQRMADYKAGRVPGGEYPELQAELRVHADALAHRSEEAFGTPNYERLKAEETKWLQDMKPLASHASELFRGLQGERELNTGNWKALANHAQDVSRKPLTPEQVSQAKTHAGEVERLTKTVESQAKRIDELLRGEAKKAPSGSKLPKDKEGLSAHFQKRIEDGSLFNSPRRGTQSGAVDIGKTPHFTIEERRAIWDYLKKNHIDSATSHVSLNDIANKAGTELGLEPDWIKDVIAGRKTALRNLSDEQLASIYHRRDAVNEAKLWASTINDGAALKTVKFIWGVARAIKTVGHGVVWPVTHVGAGGFDPLATASSIRGYVNAWKSLSASSYENLMSRMEAKPDNAFKMSSGLKISRDLAEDYQSYQKIFGKLGKLGNRQMDMLKVYRDERFDQLWRDAPDHLKTGDGKKELGQLIADQVNHESGTISAKANAGSWEPYIQGALFGPNLWRSRFARLVGDPIKTIKALGPGATPAEKYMAVYRTKRFGRIMAASAATLGSNYAILNALGVKDEDNVNFFDPSRADWLQLKDAAGHSYDLSGGLIRLAQQPAVMLKAGQESKSRGQDPLSAVGGKSWDFLTSALNPQLGAVAEAVRGKNFKGEPLPWNEATKTHAAMSWAEYITSHVAPIPLEHVSEPLFEALKEGGISDGFALKLAKAIAVGLTGVREHDKPKPKADAPGKRG